jgi:hypothetical protein
MGYTHYWYRPEKLDETKFKAAVADCKKVTDWLGEKWGIHVQFEYDDDSPAVFEDKLIRFNGSMEGGCETFAIEQTFPEDGYRSLDDTGKLFDFCKTRGYEYDTAVTACLIVFKHHLGDEFRVTSDGDKPDWQEGLKACQEALGYGEIPDTIRG